ncbi:hypothetical protein WJX73_010733 [Symbiochloris irregularis]|uniref:Ketopantoate reductase n=1 Tax=Symbiochloris irregularis TaxID=706552 RepID=A0AAW1NUW7_9CHLO
MCAAGSEPWTIIGEGRVGSALARLGTNDTIVKRGDSIPDGTGPIIVATRNDSLQSVFDATPEARRQDLVFIQNGMIQPWLNKHGLSDNTQVLAYFAVAKMGDMPSGGRTEVNPEGLTAAYGKHANTVAKRLRDGSVACRVLTQQGYTKAMLEKLVWISAFMLVGQQHGNCSVGDVVKDRKAEVTVLMAELGRAGAIELGIQLNPGVIQRLLSYAESVAHFPTAVKEFEWRNGWFYNLSKRAREQGVDDPCKLHSALLKIMGIVKD